MFSKVAETAKEKATVYGNLATQKVTRIDSKFSFVFYLLFILYIIISNKVRDGTLLEDVGSQVNVLASKVCVFLLFLF